MMDPFAPQTRVALVHDWLTGYRGGEKVLESLCGLFPQAPLFTLVHVKGSVPPTIEDRKIHTSFLQNMPLGRTKYRHYLPLFPLAAETLVRGEFDLIVSTSHAVAKSIRPGRAAHWCYIHSPMRYVWDRFDDYFGPDQVGSIPSTVFFRPIANALATYDKWTSPRVHHFVANSHFVAERVKKFYGRQAEVIPPPVDTKKYAQIKRDPKDHYLFFSALVPYKRADLAIQACQTLGRKLFVLGGGPELGRLQEMADPKWIHFIEKPSDKDVALHFSTARALIFPAVEDFGIIPVESLSAGLPVIGLRQGGLLDSQTSQTCEFFESQTVGGLKEALLSFEKKGQDFFQPALLQQQAAGFDAEIFRQKIRSSISEFYTRYTTVPQRK